MSKSVSDTIYSVKKCLLHALRAFRGGAVARRCAGPARDARVARGRERVGGPPRRCGGIAARASVVHRGGRARVEPSEPLRARRGERSRSQLHFKLGGTENMSILVVNVLIVNFWLLIVLSPSI